MKYCSHGMPTTRRLCGLCLRRAYAQRDLLVVEARRVAAGTCRIGDGDIEPGTEYCAGHNRMMRYDSAAEFAANH